MAPNDNKDKVGLPKLDELKYIIKATMKKVFFTIVIAVLGILVFSGCSKDDDNDSTGTENNSETGGSKGQKPKDLEVVDLGLPSGTKWANMNVGATKPEEYGGYYAWGETEEKDVYDWSTYIHCDGSYGTCHDLGKSICGTKYDVAHVKWGGNWQMPSAEQIEELLSLCKRHWTTLYDVAGCRFLGPNGNYIFLPAAGPHDFYDWNHGGKCGHYWSGTQGSDGAYYAYSLYFISLNAKDDGLWSNRRYNGFSVRPVTK